MLTSGKPGDSGRSEPLPAGIAGVGFIRRRLTLLSIAELAAAMRTDPALARIFVARRAADAGVVTATRTRTCRNTHLAQFVGVPDRPQRYAVQEQFLAVGRCRRWQTATHQRHIRPFPVFPSVAPQEFARNIGNQHVRIPGQTAIRPDNGFDILPYTAVFMQHLHNQAGPGAGLAIFDPVFIVSETYPRNSGHILGQGATRNVEYFG